MTEIEVVLWIGIIPDGLSRSSGFGAALILKVRALMPREETVVPHPGGNPSDDGRPAILQDTGDDLLRKELLEAIEALEVEKNAELVAPMWLGHCDAEPTDRWPNQGTAPLRHAT